MFKWLDYKLFVYNYYERDERGESIGCVQEMIEQQTVGQSRRSDDGS